MMSQNDNSILIPDRARVSIAERLVPSMSFGLIAVTGILGGVMLRQFLDTMRMAETAGGAVVSAGISKVAMAVGSGLVVAALIGVAGIAVSAIRAVITTKKASPPGLLPFFAGLIALVSPTMMAAALWMTIAVLNSQQPNISVVAETALMLALLAIVFGALSIVMLLIFSFVPFSSRTGAKYSPTIALIVLEAALVALAVSFFFMARASIATMDRF